MRKNHKLVLINVALILSLFTSCDDKVTNNAPEINSINASIEDAFIGEEIVLEVDADDAETENISFLWSVDGAEIVDSKLEKTVRLLISKSVVDVELAVSDGEETTVVNYQYNAKRAQFYDQFDTPENEWKTFKLQYAFSDGECLIATQDTSDYSTLTYPRLSGDTFVFNGYKTTFSTSNILDFEDSYLLSVAFQRLNIDMGKQVSYLAIYAHPSSIYDLTTNWKLKVGLYDLEEDENTYYYLSIPQEQQLSDLITNLNEEDRTITFELNKEGEILISVNGTILIETVELKELISKENLIFKRNFYYLKYGIYNDCNLCIDNVYIW